MTVEYLAECAAELLAAAEAALVEDTTGRPAPSAAWVAWGTAPRDRCCDDGQITVHPSFLSHEQFGRFGEQPTTQHCQRTPQPTFVITVLRCHPTMGGDASSPTPDAQESAANGLLGDLWALLTELYDRARACTLFGGMAHCTDVNIGDVEIIEPESGCAGFAVPVTFVANDTGPEGS